MSGFARDEDTGQFRSHLQRYMAIRLYEAGRSQINWKQLQKSALLSGQNKWSKSLRNMTRHIPMNV
jgi:hypothetical protein